MSDDIYRIVERLAILEGRLTPTTVKHGLNPQQQSVKQLPALFKPRDISPTLSKPPYQKHPMDGWLVGEGKVCEKCDCDPCECDDEKITEAQANEEKLLDKVKKSFIDYLDSVEDRVKKDADLKDKKSEDTDLKKKEKKDRDLIAKIKEDPTEQEPANTDLAPTQPVQDPTYSVSSPSAIKTMTMEDGRTCEIHGDEAQGFEIRHGDRALKSRFRTVDEASMALEMYRSRCRQRAQSADYIEER